MCRQIPVNLGIYLSKDNCLSFPEVEQLMYVMKYGKKQGMKILFSYIQCVKGYLNKIKETSKNFSNFIGKYIEQGKFKQIHTLRHADIETLREVLNTLNPEAIIPVHTNNPEKFKEIFSGRKVIILNNADKYKIK